MSNTIQQLISDWSGRAVITVHDEATDSWTFIALHDDRLGTPMGGTRMKVYESPADGLLDAMQLAEGMTYKWASIDIPFGGGKAVMALSRALEGAEREGVLRRYGALLNTLGGCFTTAEDLGTSPEDMVLLSGISPYINGADPERGIVRDPGPYTALGVVSAIRASFEHLFSENGLQGCSVLVQGVGDVGEPLVRLLADEGARVLISDIDAEQAERVASDVGAEVVSASEVYTTECDVYAPCAVGATLNGETIPQLRCRIVAGSANNQLGDPSDAARLHERGILYAPDYVANAGGATFLGCLAGGVTEEEKIRERVISLRGALKEIFGIAAERNESPALGAQRRVERILERGPR